MVGDLTHCIRIGIVLLLGLCKGQFQCDDEFSCANMAIAGGGTDIWCYGLGSCAGSTIVNYGTSDDGKTTGCWGGRSCQNAPIFSGIVEYDSDIRGHLGLAWTKYVDTRIIACFGEAACYQIENTRSNRLLCYGFRSCDGLYSNSATIAAGLGTLSLENSILHNPSSVYLVGFFSGYNATVYCESGHICNISCYSNGCENLNFMCENGANCTVNCNDTQGITCPNGWNSSSIYDININNDYWSDNNYESGNYEVLQMISSVFGNYILNTNETDFYTYKSDGFDNECDEDDDTTDDIVCGNATECQYTSIYSKNNVCCSGHASCRYSVTKDFDTVYCDASDACLASIINGTININIGGSVKLSNIYARGRYSTSYGSISDFNFMMASGDASTSDSKIEYGNYLACFGRFSCYNTTITGVRNIYAGAQYAMRASTITSGGIGELNVYLLDSLSGIGMNIICTVGDVCNIYCINSECDDYIGDVVCSAGTIGTDCQINWFYSLPTNAPTKSPTSMPTVLPTVTTTATTDTVHALSSTVTTTNNNVTSTDSDSTNTLTMTLTMATKSTPTDETSTGIGSTITTVIMTEEELYSTTDEEIDAKKEQSITGNYKLYNVCVAYASLIEISVVKILCFNTQHTL